MEFKASVSSQSTSSISANTSITKPGIPAGVKFAFGLAIFIALTIYAFVQPTRPTPLSVPTTWDAFIYPQERNAFLKLPSIKAEFNDVFAFEDTGLVWAVGDNGFIIHSADSGQSWSQQTFLGGPVLESTQDESASLLNSFLPISSAWAAEEPFAEQYETQAPEQQVLPSPPTNLGLDKQSLAGTKDVPPDSEEEIAQAEEFDLQSEAEAEPSWPPESSLIQSPNLLTIYFTDSYTGFITGSNDTILKTENAGQTWLKVDSNSGSVNRGYVKRTFDGGETLPVKQPQLGVTVNSVALINSNTAIAAGSGGTLIKTTNAGESWYALAAPKFTGVHAPNSRTLIVRDEHGAILKSSDAGISWKPISAETAGNIKDLEPVGFNAAYTVEDLEDTLEAMDGEDWETQSIDPQTFIRAVSKIDNGSAIIVGDNGNILTTTDSGATWATPYSAYRRSPAFWYWLACAIFIGFGMSFARRQPQAETEPTSSIEDILASDRPLEPGDPDPLEFGAIARGLSRFMRNPSTEPPLTVAVTGAWGTGKSSLMNLLHYDLKKYGFTPVWFNAWHHQKGEQLLASLYSNIRNQAIPGWFKFNGPVPVGLLFRINLLFRRSIKNWLVTLLLITLFIAAATYLIENPSGLDGLSAGHLLAAFSEADNFEKLMVLLLGNIAPLAALFRGMRAFGLNPTSLLALGTGKTEARNKVDPGARQRFAREFNEVTQCLELGRMVIFIDDLDRCSKENVVDILESINFLSVSGDCYIVLGMDEEWVKVCIEQQFPEMAKKDNGEVNHDFAENYLEKMINIKVPVPTLEAEDSSKLLTPELPDSKPPSKLKVMTGWVKQQIVRYRYLTLLAAICVLGIVSGLNIDNWLLAFSEPEAQLSADQERIVPVQTWDNANIEQLDMNGGQPSFRISVGNSDAGAGGGAEGSELQLELRTTERDIKQGIVIGRFGDESSSASLVLKQREVMETGITDPVSNSLPEFEEAPEFSNGQKSMLSATNYWLPGLTVLILLAGIVAYSMKRPERIVRDSSEFRDALSIWHSWILFNRQTPRAIKRFLNRVRYIAMRYREEPESDTQKRTFLNRLITIFRSSKNMPNPEANENFITEPSLVALSAIFALDESWLIDQEKFELIQNGNIDELLREKFNNFLIKMEGDTSVAQKHIQTLTESLSNHRNKFGDDIFSSFDARAKFLKVMAVAEFS